MKGEGIQPEGKLQLWLKEFITENEKRNWNPEQTCLLKTNSCSNLRSVWMYSFCSACKYVLCYPGLSECKFCILKIRKDDEPFLI